MARGGGGLAKVRIDFSSVKDLTLGEVYGTRPIPVFDLSKRIWKLIKDKKLQVREGKA